MPTDQVLVGNHPVMDGVDFQPRGDNYGNRTVQFNRPWYHELVRRGQGYTFTQAAAGVPAFPPLITTSVNDGSLVVNRRYRITFVGTSDFTTAGASANTVGIEFLATNAGGAGSGTCDQILNNFLIQNPSGSGRSFMPLKATIALATTVIAPVLSNFCIFQMPNASVAMGGSTGYVAGVNSYIGGPGYSSSMIFTPQSGTPPIVGASTAVSPTFVKSLGFSILNNDLTNKNTFNYDIDLEDRYMLYPGYTMCIAPNAALASPFVISLFGVELITSTAAP